MNLLYLNVIEQNRGWGAEEFVNRGLLSLNVKTHCIDYRNQRFQLGNKLRQAPQCDAVLLQRAEGIPLHLIRAINRPRFFWASELVSRRRDQDNLIKSGLFKHIFFHTQDCIDSVVGRGWIDRSKCSVLLNGFESSTFFPIKHPEKDIDVLFIGNITRRREFWLEQLANMGIKIHVTKAFGQEMNALFQRSKIILNIHAENYLDTETRVFEVLGSGSLLLTEPLSRDNPFVPNVHYIEANSISQMADITKTALAKIEDFESIRLAGYHEAIEKHQYVNRAQEINNIMSAFCDSKTNTESFIDTPRLKVRRKLEDIINWSSKQILKHL